MEEVRDCIIQIEYAFTRAGVGLNKMYEEMRNNLTRDLNRKLRKENAESKFMVFLEKNRNLLHEISILNKPLKMLPCSLRTLMLGIPSDLLQKAN